MGLREGVQEEAHDEYILPISKRACATEVMYGGTSRKQ